MDRNVTVREIRQEDNAAIEGVIRSCLIEFGANHEGTAWADEFLGRLSEVYGTEGNRYWVAADQNGKILAGVGIGKLADSGEICELQKMYCLPEARGTGVADRLMRMALGYAQKYYRFCYLETMENMIAAQKFYQKYGFKRIYEEIVHTEHFNCDVMYLKDLKGEN